MIEVIKVKKIFYNVKEITLNTEWRWTSVLHKAAKINPLCSDNRPCSTESFSYLLCSSGSNLQVSVGVIRCLWSSATLKHVVCFSVLSTVAHRIAPLCPDVGSIVDHTRSIINLYVRTVIVSFAIIVSTKMPSYIVLAQIYRQPIRSRPLSLHHVTMDWQIT